MNHSDLKSELNIKNLKAIIFIAIVIVLTVLSAHAQRKFGGRVVEVLDGKTCVIQLTSGKLTAILQYIEIPEPEQQLRQTVKDHLQGLILDKQVEFMPRGMRDVQESVGTFAVTGQLMIKGVDVSQQMIRDGAAWHMIPENSGQDAAESLVYQDNETQAKKEKRGIWGIEDLKPSWEYRAEQLALRLRKEEEASKNVSFVPPANQNKKVVPRQQVAAQVEMWADVGGGSSFDQPMGIGGLRMGYDPALQLGHISTPSVFLDFPSGDFLKKVESRIFYFYKGDKSNIEDSVYVVGFLTTSKDYKFLKSNTLTVTADSQKFVFAKPRRFSQKNMSSVNELLLYKITRAQLMKIAKAQNIAVQFGGYQGGLSNESIMFINNLLTAS